MSMREKGVNFVYGNWLIEGAPRVILFELDSVRHFLNEWKADLWSLVGIPSPEHDHETNDAILLGYVVVWFLGEVSKLDSSHAIIGHFHEWLAGVALPLCRKKRIDVVTIFTTHATLLGRYLCAAGDVDFITIYSILMWTKKLVREAYIIGTALSALRLILPMFLRLCRKSLH